MMFWCTWWLKFVSMEMITSMEIFLASGYDGIESLEVVCTAADCLSVSLVGGEWE